MTQSSANSDKVDGLIAKSSYDLVKEIRKHYPNCRGVAVCAFDTVDAYFEDSTFTTHVADIDYHYSNDSLKNSLFGYDYKLVWK